MKRRAGLSRKNSWTSKCQLIGDFNFFPVSGKLPNFHKQQKERQVCLKYKLCQFCFCFKIYRVGQFRNIFTQFAFFLSSIAIHLNTITNATIAKIQHEQWIYEVQACYYRSYIPRNFLFINMRTIFFLLYSFCLFRVFSMLSWEQGNGFWKSISYRLLQYCL